MPSSPHRCVACSHRHRRCCGPHRSGAPMSLKTSQPTPGVRPARRRGAGWLLPAGLITFGLVPILANALRRVAMAVAPAAPSSGEGGGMSLPVILHVVGATVFVVLGALQFSAALSATPAVVAPDRRTRGDSGSSARRRLRALARIRHPCGLLSAAVRLPASGRGRAGAVHQTFMTSAVPTVVVPTGSTR